MKTNANNIMMYVHCKMCLKEIDDGVPDTDADQVTPRDYQLLEVGWTDKGLQIWCRRHNVNVCHFMVSPDKDGVEIDGTKDNSTKEHPI